MPKEKQMTTFNLDPISKMELYNVSASRVSYRGKPALRLIEQEDGKESHSIAVISDSIFKNGVIETEIAGSLRADAPESMRRSPSRNSVHPVATRAPPGRVPLPPLPWRPVRVGWFHPVIAGSCPPRVTPTPTT